MRNVEKMRRLDLVGCNADDWVSALFVGLQLTGTKLVGIGLLATNLAFVYSQTNGLLFS